jgi:hypothetical protein
MTADFSKETLKTRRHGLKYLTTERKKCCKHRLLHPAKISFITEGETKTFHDKQKPSQFMTTKPALQKIHKEILHMQVEHKCSHVNMALKIPPDEKINK